MITVASAVEKIITASPLLEEGLARNLFNVSALARDMLPEVEAFTKKQVTEGSLVMALNRLQGNLPDYLQKSPIVVKTPDLIIRSNLVELNYTNSDSLNHHQQKLLALTARYREQHFLTITTGVFETTIICSASLHKAIEKILEHEQLISKVEHLSSVTVRLTQDQIDQTGSYANILRKFAWNNVNVVEIVSTYQELTIIVEESATDKAVQTLLS